MDEFNESPALFSRQCEIYVKSGDRWMHIPAANVNISKETDYATVESEAGVQMKYKTTTNWTMTAGLIPDDNSGLQMTFIDDPVFPIIKESKKKPLWKRLLGNLT